MKEFAEPYPYEIDRDSPSLEQLRYIAQFISRNSLIQHLCFQTRPTTKQMRNDVGELNTLMGKIIEIHHAPLDVSRAERQAFLHDIEKFFEIFGRYNPRLSNLTLAQIATQGRIAVAWNLEFQSALRNSKPFQTAQQIKDKPTMAAIAKETAEKLRNISIN